MNINYVYKLYDYFPIISFCGLIFMRKYHELLVKAIIVYILSFGLKALFSLIINNKNIILRPKNKKAKCGNSNIGFPSSHSMLSMFYILYFYRKKNLLSLFICTIPISRLITNCHNELQVLAGIFFGTVSYVALKPK